MPAMQTIEEGDYRKAFAREATVKQDQQKLIAAMRVFINHLQGRRFFGSSIQKLIDDLVLQLTSLRRYHDSFLHDPVPISGVGFLIEGKEREISKTIIELKELIDQGKSDLVDLKQKFEKYVGDMRGLRSFIASLEEKYPDLQDKEILDSFATHLYTLLVRSVNPLINTLISTYNLAAHLIETTAFEKFASARFDNPDKDNRFVINNLLIALGQSKEAIDSILRTAQKRNPLEELDHEARTFARVFNRVLRSKHI